MRRSLGLVDSKREDRLKLADVAFGNEGMEGGNRSCIWKDEQTVGTEDGKGEGEVGDEGVEVVEEYPLGIGAVESPSRVSMSLMGSKGVEGGTSSTSTSE